MSTGMKKTLSILGTLLFVFMLYTSFLSEDARKSMAVTDIVNTYSFLSQKVSSAELDDSLRTKSLDFSNVEKSEKKNLERLGRVFLIGKEENILSSLILYKSGERYIIYMRGIYLKIGL